MQNDHNQLIDRLLYIQVVKKLFLTKMLMIIKYKILKKENQINKHFHKFNDLIYLLEIFMVFKMRKMRRK
jgi:hypothetical protein